MDIQRLVSNGKISKLKNNLDKEIFKINKIESNHFLQFFFLGSMKQIFSGYHSTFHIFCVSPPTRFEPYPEYNSKNYGFI